MPTSIKTVIDEFVRSDRGKEAFARAMGKAAAIGSLQPSDFLKSEIETVLREIDAIGNSEPGYSLALALICWQVAQGGPIQVDGGGLTDLRLKGQTAFLVAQSMLSIGNHEGGEH